MENKPNGHGIALDFNAVPSSSDEKQYDGAQILDRIASSIRHYVHLSDAQSRIVSLWIAHTHAVTAFSTTPYLQITSAVKQSGKTRLLETLELLVAKPWFTGRVTAAVLVRKIDQTHCTLLLDESDAAFKSEKEYAEALRGILNTGFYSSGVASCCVGQGANVSFKDFRTYGAKAIAGIGELPDTIADRSIPIRLERKRQGEVVARFRRRYAKELVAPIRMQVAEWMESICARLKDAEPALPEELTDRQQDGLEPLLAIADEAGGAWPAAIREAAVAIFGSSADQNIGVQLLADIWTVFEEKSAERMSSAALVTALAEIETSPWAEWKNGKPMTTIQLARQLRLFKVTPRNMRIDCDVLKGYERQFFDDAWSRYLPQITPALPSGDIRPATPPQPASLLDETDFSTRYINAGVAVKESGSEPHEHCVVAGVAGQEGHQGGPDTNEALFRSPKPQRKTIPNCGNCGSYALYKERDGTIECQTCGARVAPHN